MDRKSKEKKEQKPRKIGPTSPRRNKYPPDWDAKPAIVSVGGPAIVAEVDSIGSAVVASSNVCDAVDEDGATRGSDGPGDDFDRLELPQVLLEENSTDAFSLLHGEIDEFSIMSR